MLSFNLKSLTVLISIGLGSFILAQSGPVHAQFKPRMTSRAKQGNCYSPRWSHDGKKLSYEVHFPEKNTRETYIVDLEGGGSVTQVTPSSGPSGSFAAFSEKGAPPVKELAWHPKGRAFLYSSTGDRSLFELFMQGEGILTGDPKKFAAGNKHQPRWSPDGNYVVYAKELFGGGELFMFNIFQLEKGEIKLTESDGATSYQPRWSPDGKRIVYSRFDESDSENDLYIIDDFTNPTETSRQLTSLKGDELNPYWSPDGLNVAFFSNTGNKEGKVFDLYVVAAAGGGPRRLARDVIKPDRSGPVWTPDSKHIIFVGRDHDKLDPIQWISVEKPEQRGVIKTNTELNDDMDLFVAGDTLKLAYTALAEKGDKQKTWRKVYIVDIPKSTVESTSAQAEKTD